MHTCTHSSKMADYNAMYKSEVILATIYESMNFFILSFHALQLSGILLVNS